MHRCSHAVSEASTLLSLPRRVSQVTFERVSCDRWEGPRDSVCSGCERRLAPRQPRRTSQVPDRTVTLAGIADVTGIP